MKQAGQPRLSASVSRVLHYGVFLSVVVTAAGFLWIAFAGGTADGAIPFARLFSSLASGDPRSVLSAGIILLLLTPVAGVVVALYEFARGREHTWAFISLALLLILAAGFLAGLA